MDSFFGGVQLVSNFIWGGEWGETRIVPVMGPVAWVLLSTGLFFMLRLGFRPLRRLGPAIAQIWTGRKGQGDGEISPWQALSTALAGQVGTGNLAGVATAITLGGPGAIFWMWVTAILGMAAAFAESSLAVKYRERHPDGHVHGGPMYYIRNGLGKGWTWLAILFCIGTLFSAMATGGMIQANSVTQSAVQAISSVGVPATGTAFIGVPLENFIVGAIVAAFTFLVIIGGIKSIGSFAGKLVPFMALTYVVAALVVLGLNVEHIGDAFGLIFTNALGWEQAAGGFSGAVLAAAIRAGVARGLFSNEAGQGSAPIAHAAAQTNDPVKQGEYAMVGVFIDTIVICTMTALVILVVEGAFVSGGGAETVAYAWQSTDLRAAAITTAAFGAGIPYGEWIVFVAQVLFAFTTIIGWSYYGEQAVSFLFGDKAALPFRYLWVVIVFVGCLVVNVDGLWLLGDIANASMLFPNVIAIVALSGVVVAMAREADERRRRELLGAKG